jgi:glycosyltransferase involved in cell wall biosynthesis
MVIAVYINTSPVIFVNDNFITESFLRLAKQYTKHQFIFITYKGFDEKLITSKNITPVVLGAPPKKSLLLQYHLNYKVPAILRKYKVDVLLTADGLCSLRTKVPQCVIINDLSFLKQSKLYPGSWLRFYKNNTAKFLAKAKIIIATSQFLKDDIVTHYKIVDDKITVAYYGTNENFKPAFWQQNDVVKQTYTEGLEYFLYSGPIHPQQNLIALLKAFSFFKKRQKSNMQLIIASTAAVTDKDLVKSLGSFKYRNEAKIFDQLPEEIMAKITAAAYALVYPSAHQVFAWSVAEAMQSDVPVIAGNTAIAKEICGDAAVYVNPDDFNDIAEKMMLLFKDENKRFELIAKGRQRAGLYQWDKTATIIWDALNKCANSYPS